MPLFTKDGSFPKPQTDGTSGWVLVPDMPTAPEGKEVVWLNWSWVTRDPKPEAIEGHVWKWNADQAEWISYALEQEVVEEVVEPAPSGTEEAGTVE